MKQSNQAQLVEHYASLAKENVPVGIATVVCVGFGQWALPGGEIVTSKADARKAAVKIDRIMRGVV